MRASQLTAALFALSLFQYVCVASGACETEEDLDFETCDLKDLKDDVLVGICNRIGLDMTTHVLPYLLEEEGEDKIGDSYVEDAPTKTYTHEEYVLGADECLLIEDEMHQLEEDDPEYLAQLEREALAEDPEVVAEIVADVLKQDEKLLKEISAKLLEDSPEVVKEMEGMLGEGEKLESRPDVVGFIVAKLLGEENNLDLLDNFDEALAEHYFGDYDIDEDWGDEETDVGDGDEL